jgi:fatty acid CoA ligase FadD9
MRWAAVSQQRPLAASFDEVCASAAARGHVLVALQAAAREAGLSSLEVPQAVHLEPQEWQVASGLVTPTAKLVRHKLRQRYGNEVAAMYAQIRD